MIGSNLSQTKEFRDLFEDIITKVKQCFYPFFLHVFTDTLMFLQIAEPLEECGVTGNEMGQILSACYYVVQDIPDSGRVGASARASETSSRLIAAAGETAPLSMKSQSQSRAQQLRAEWLRFVTFCQMTLGELLVVDRKN